MGSRPRSKRRARAARNADPPPEEPPRAGPRREPSLIERYLELQCLVGQLELAKVMAALRRPLPIALRFNETAAGRAAGVAALRELFALNRLLQDPANAPRELPWGGVQLAVTQADLRASPDPYVAAVRQWLRAHRAAVVRQEAVSQLPAVLLQVRRGQAALDMCAAPGSKTTQLLAHVGPSGAVVANDVDARRADILAHRVAAAVGAEAAQGLLVVSHRAQTLPAAAPFDRVLADVPCSGSGTLRKDHKLWSVWTPSFALRLHRLQLQIAMRGVALLRPGGLMVYSTCSFDPVENEAVVAEVLRRGAGAVELVPAPDVLPRLRAAVFPGVSSWLVTTDALDELDGFEQVPREWRGLYRPSMWPPADGQFPLERCVRLYPHTSDTGGFFVALLRKVGPLPHSKAPPAVPRAPPILPAHALHRVERDVVKAAREDAGLRRAFDKLPLRTRCAPGRPVTCLRLVGRGVAAVGALHTVWGGVAVLRLVDGSWRLTADGAQLLAPVARHVVAGSVSDSGAVELDGADVPADTVIVRCAGGGHVAAYRRVGGWAVC